MVQRKVPNKLTIQADHVKTSTLLANLVNKPSSPRGGPDLTKKMKKSRPIKRSSDHIDSLRSSPLPLRKEAAQPGKPPPISPQKPKQSPTKSTSTSQRLSPAKLLLEGSPNYMKSTSSFDARKDRSAPRTSQTPLVHKTASPKKPEKPKLGNSAAGYKASRTSSLELVRTLTKTPSFKPSRVSKKCSPVALCEEFDVQRATCSSTLKDSKFPEYLELDQGGTELEGTSSMKVCPYTYCSLNGHHHAPLPPLKSFLSARRRMLKTQKSFKLGCLSPRRTPRVGTSSEIMNDADAGLVIPPKETAIQQKDLEPLEVSPGSLEHTQFFIEIYSKDEEDGDIVESPDTDFNNFKGNCDAISIEIDVGELSPDYWMEGVAEETCPPLRVQEETTVESHNQSDQPNFEASDMEWELKSLEMYAKTNGVYDEESVGSEAWMEDGDSDMDSYSGSDQFLDMSNNQTSDATIEADGEAKDEMEAEQIDAAKSVVQIEQSDSVEGFIAANLETAGEDAYGSKINQSFTNEGPSSNIQDDSSDMQSETINEVEIPDSLENDSEEAKTFNPSINHQSEDQTESGALRFWKNEISEQATEDTEEECTNNCNGENSCSTTKIKSNEVLKKLLPHVPSTSDDELLKTCSNLRIVRNKRSDGELEGQKDFNPREPNFLPLEPDLEGEKVDLRHQMMDDRKNAEEWMVDFALQQAVTRLATARKKKVSLLVEAFEKVTPIPKYQSHLRQASRAFEHTGTIQACS